jgi:glutaminyl-tRNA synthetase
VPAAASTSAAAAPEEKVASEFSNIEEMYAGRDLKEARNSQATLAKVREATGGKIVTRFPPEPNGYLHLGHAKAMRFNFGLASRTNGNCILRFDDTNPDAESIEYIDNIIENVHWMGHKPSSINYSSDYFQTLYELAQKLIRKGHAYVCHQTKAEIEVCRETRQPSPYRDRSVEENLRLLEVHFYVLIICLDCHHRC